MGHDLSIDFTIVLRSDGYSWSSVLRRDCRTPLSDAGLSNGGGSTITLAENIWGLGPTSLAYANIDWNHCRVDGVFRRGKDVNSTVSLFYLRYCSVNHHSGVGQRHTKLASKRRELSAGIYSLDWVE